MSDVVEIRRRFAEGNDEGNKPELPAQAFRVHSKTRMIVSVSDGALDEHSLHRLSEWAEAMREGNAPSVLLLEASGRIDIKFIEPSPSPVVEVHESEPPSPVCPVCKLIECRCRGI